MKGSSLLLVLSLRLTHHMPAGSIVVGCGLMYLGWRSRGWAIRYFITNDNYFTKTDLWADRTEEASLFGMFTLPVPLLPADMDVWSAFEIYQTRNVDMAHRFSYNHQLASCALLHTRINTVAQNEIYALCIWLCWVNSWGYRQRNALLPTKVTHLKPWDAFQSVAVVLHIW